MTEEIVERKDVLAMILPTEELDEHDPQAYLLLYQACVTYVHAEYEHLPLSERPKISIQNIETMVTRSPRELDDFPLSHDCDGCRGGVNAARTALLDNPKHLAAIANVYYTEHHA